MFLTDLFFHFSSRKASRCQAIVNGCIKGHKTRPRPTTPPFFANEKRPFVFGWAKDKTELVTLRVSSLFFRNHRVTKSLYRKS
jgi:hypothetical protein